jgi:hypothetical protein
MLWGTSEKSYKGYEDEETAHWFFASDVTFLARNVDFAMDHLPHFPD